MAAVPTALRRGSEYLRAHGATATARRFVEHARRLVHLRETHVWYRLDLAAEFPHRDLPHGLTLRRGVLADVSLLEKLNTVAEDDARARLGRGAQLWLALEVERVAFACWIFEGEAPVLAAAGGWLRLPPGVVVLEDSVTHKEFRGRGLAPAVWAVIADSLWSHVSTTMYTKVAETNHPSRRAVEKAGFRVAATMRFRRLAGRRTVTVATTGTEEAWLVRTLSTGQK